MTAWNKIETAPKDGTFLLLAVGENIFIGRWLESVRLEFGKETSRCEYWSMNMSFATLSKPEPTHWAKIPEFDGE